jgi:hypothetical protein
MAMMVNGSLRCFGSPSHLRDLFAEGFTIIVKFILNPKKIYFTTIADQYNVHDEPKPKTENNKNDEKMLMDNERKAESQHRLKEKSESVESLYSIMSSNLLFSAGVHYLVNKTINFFEIFIL